LSEQGIRKDALFCFTLEAFEGDGVRLQARARVKNRG
jgi:hypothetical protein